MTATETTEDYFERRARAVAADVGARVTFDHDTEYLQAMLRAGGAFCRFSVDRGSSGAMARNLIDREVEDAGDSLYAVTHTDIPAGAVWMMRGARTVQGESTEEQPIIMLDRRARTYQRAGDAHPRPWPPVVFYAQGRRGFVEVRTAA
jgi:hypothetical protein